MRILSVGIVRASHYSCNNALCGRGGVRAVIAGNLLLKQQLIVVRRPRQRAPRLTASDRLLFGFGSLFLSPGRIRKVAIGVRPSTLLAFQEALVRRNYRRLFSSSECPKKPGPKGPSEALIRTIVELKPPLADVATQPFDSIGSGRWWTNALRAVWSERRAPPWIDGEVAQRLASQTRVYSSPILRAFRVADRSPERT